MTVIMFIEYYATKNEATFANRGGSFYPAMITLAGYGVITAAQTFTLFYRGDEKTELKVYIILHVFRTILMITSSALLFT